jgi:hypothetical protein
VLRRGLEQHQFGRSTGRRLRRQLYTYPPRRTTESPSVRLLCCLQEHDRCVRAARQEPSICVCLMEQSDPLLASRSRAHKTFLLSEAQRPLTPRGCRRTAGCTGYTWDSNDGGWCYLKHVPKCNSTRSSPGQYTASATLKVAPTGVPLDGFVPGKCIYTHTGGR